VTQPQTQQPPDPLAVWREWLTQSERQWNAFLNEVMGTEQFSQSMGRFMDVYLNMQKSMNDLMGRYFTAINVPTRTDVLALGDRLAAIEERLESIESKVARLADGESKQPLKAEFPRPPRTRKPAANTS
jgi:polyhydroxyalkanoic acid synthase PhaR subunit